MSSTPIFDQMIAEYPLELRKASNIFPMATVPEYWRKRREESMAKHPSQGGEVTVSFPIEKMSPGVLEVLYGHDMAKKLTEQAKVTPLSGRVMPDLRKPPGAWGMKRKPMVPQPNTRLIMGFDPATLEPMVVANVDEKGTIVWIQP